VTSALLELDSVTKYFPVKLPTLQRLVMSEPPVVHAVDGVTCSINRGEIFGLVGESGCGKTTLGRTVVRLVKPTSGRITFDGVDISDLPALEDHFVVDFLSRRLRRRSSQRSARSRDPEVLWALRRKIQIIFQDPHAALNPAMTIGESIMDPLLVHRLASPAEARKAVLSIMTEVGLSPAEVLFTKFPSELSVGQKQRAVIARAIILRPALIVADEPVAMLDMSVRARILELMLDLKNRYGLTYLFITHDLATAKFICDRIAIMYLGRIVEIGRADEIYAEPKHPYTQALLGAIPTPEPGRRRKKALPRGEVPDAIYPPQGCRFHPRCPVATSTCGWEPEDIIDLLDRRALEAGVGMRDEEILGGRRRMRSDGATFRVRLREPGLTSREQRWLTLAAFVSAAPFLLVNPYAALTVLLSSLVTIGACETLSRRESSRLNLVRDGAQRVRNHLETILRVAPEPLVAAVRAIGVTEKEATVEFVPAVDPGLRDVGGREVRCVLY